MVPRSNTPQANTTAPPLDDNGILRYQSIVGELLYYSHSIDKKLLVVLSKFVQQQDTAMGATNDSIHQILDYVATYPNNGITYRASCMVLSVHSDAA